MAFLIKNSLKFLTPRLVKIAPYNAFYLSTSTSQLLQKHNTAQNNDGIKTTAQKKSKESFKITLIQNQNISVTGLEDARNLAKRRSMHLLQVEKMDSKTQRPVYKLVTSAEKLQVELSDLKSSETSNTEKASQKKSEKSLNIGARMGEHDLASRLKNISKWLSKQHEVRILIQGSDKDFSSCEKIFKSIEEHIKTPEVVGKIVQKRNKGSVIKFNILPIDSTTEKTNSDAPTQ